MYNETTPPAHLLARIAELEAQLAASEAARTELTAALYAAQAHQAPGDAPAASSAHDSAQPAAAADLRAGEIRLRLALAAANMVAWEWDLHTDEVIWISDSAQRFNLAGAQSGHVSVFWHRFIPPADLEALRRAINTTAVHTETRVEHRYYRDDGSMGWVETLVRVTAMQHGRPTHLTGVSIEISRHKELEQTLRKQSLLQEALAGALHALHSHGHDPVARLRIFTVTAMQFCMGVAAEHVLFWEWVADELLFICAADSDGRLLPDQWRIAVGDLPEPVQANLSAPNSAPELLAVPQLAGMFGNAVHYYLFPVEWPDVRWGGVAVGVAPERRFGQPEVHFAATVIEMLRTTIRRWLAVDALQASERNLRMALTAGQLSTWEVDLATQQITLSARHAALFGAPPEGGTIALAELIARLHPDDRERGLVSMASVAEGYASPGLEVRVLQPDGAIVWVRGRGQLVRNTLGVPERIVGVLADITDERLARDLIARSNAELERRVAERTLALEQANRNLSESRRFLERVLAASPSRVNIFDYASRQVVYSNASLTDQFGYTPDELAALGGPYPLPQLLHPDDLAAIPAQVARQLAMADDEVLEREFRMRHADGSWRWFVTYDVVFARDVDGTPVQILGQVMEITGRKQIEAALKDAYTQLEALNVELSHNSRLLHTIINSLSDGLALIDGDGRLLMVNGSLGALCGLDPADAVGRDWRDLELFQASPALAQAIAAGLNFSSREQVSRHGETYVFDVQAFSLPDAQAARQAVVRLVDVTEQLQVQAVLIQNERLAATGRLAAVVAHEVNSPLQAIQNFLFLAASDDPAERNAYLTMVANEIDRIGGLIRRLLDLQRPDAAAVRTIEFHSLITQVLTLISGTLLRNRVRVDIDLAPEELRVIGRSDECSQVLFNLFVNAIDAMPHGGVLTVRSHQRRPLPADGFGAQTPYQVAQIDVCDTGPGIPADLIGRVFEPFYTTKPGGSGLGLAISRQIIEQHGGRLTAANLHPVGAVFQIILPLSEPDLN